MKISYRMREILRSMKDRDWTIGNTNATADALLKRGLIREASEQAMHSWRVRYELTDEGRAAIS